jgi:hypothetical protein
MLQKIAFLPGFNKQVTSTGAESQWTGGENVRFRYGTPEKIGGWKQLGESKLTGVARGLYTTWLIPLLKNLLSLAQTEFYMHTLVVFIMTFTL